MSMPLSNHRAPRETEFSHGASLAAHPDSDYQTARKLPWDAPERDGGAKRGGFTGSMQLAAQHRTDPTRSDDIFEEMLYVKGNPDQFGPDMPIVQEPVHRSPREYRQPVIRYGVYRED